jgi:hypothetical protein
VRYCYPTRELGTPYNSIFRKKLSPSQRQVRQAELASGKIHSIVLRYGNPEEMHIQLTVDRIGNEHALRDRLFGLMTHTASTSVIESGRYDMRFPRLRHGYS